MTDPDRPVEINIPTTARKRLALKLAVKELSKPGQRVTAGSLINELIDSHPLVQKYQDAIDGKGRKIEVKEGGDDHRG